MKQIEWTQFAAEAEAEHFGMGRLCRAHNNLLAEAAKLRRELKELADKCRALNKRENDLMMLRNAVEQMMAPLGYHGEISARDDRVQAVMDALAQVDEIDQ